MKSRLFRKREETYEEMRRRMIAETSVYLTECLRYPELAPQIPQIPAGSGRFPPSMSRAFWDNILFN